MRANSLVLKSIGRHPATAVIVSVLPYKKAMEIKTIEIIGTDNNLCRIFFLLSTDNNTDMTYKMVKSIAASYKFLRANGLRPQVVLVAHDNFVEYCLGTLVYFQQGHSEVPVQN